MIIKNDIEQNKQIVLDAIKKYQEEYGWSPTVRELCTLTGFRSPASIKQYLDILEEEGKVSRMKDSPRALTVNE